MRPDGALMSSKVANYVALALILGLGCLYLYLTSQIATDEQATTLGPGYFPTVLGIVLVALCLVAIVRETRAEQARLPLPRLRELGLTVAITGFYFLAWEELGFFYLFTSLFILALLATYSRLRRSARSMAVNLAIAIGFTAAIYASFGLVLGMRFQ